MNSKALKIGLTTVVLVLAFGGLLWSTLRDGTEYYKHVEEVMAQPDGWYGKRLQLHGYVVPSKGYEMMALGRPLLVVSDPSSEMRLLVEERGCGLTVDDRAAAIVDALRHVAGGDADLAAMAQRAQSAATEFARDEQFASFIASLSPA